MLKPLVRMPPVPGNLGKAGKKEWKRLGPLLIKAGLLTEIDLTAFSVYCGCVDTYETAKKSIEKLGITVPDREGGVKRNPASVELKDSRASMLAYSKRFGLDPYSRKDKGITAPVGDPFIDLLQQDTR